MHATIIILPADPAHCPDCEGSGYRDVKGDVHAGYDYCRCPIGRRTAAETRARYEREEIGAAEARERGDLPY